MTTLQSIEQKIEIAVNAISGILPEGYYTTYTISSTDYGVSGYILVKKICPINYIVDICKVRISDHAATNRVRQATEIMIDLLRFNLDELMTRIDRTLNPENYTQVEVRTLTTLTYTQNFNIGCKPFTTLSEPTYLGQVISQKGNLQDRYSWFKEEVHYEWVKVIN